MKFPERVRVATTGVGTGPLTMVATAVSAEFRTVAAAGLVAGDTFPYSIGLAGSAEWECGVATITTISNGTVTFSRTPTASSNNNQLVNFSAGTKEVVCTPLGATLTKWENGTSPRVIFTSSLCVSDTDLSFASDASGVDQVVKLQALLDLAQNGSLILMFDGGYTLGASSTTTSLRIRSNTKVLALPGCGAKMAPNSPVPMWRNYNPMTPSMGAIVDHDIEICGGIWHGNSANQSVRETDANGGMSTFDFVGVNGLRMTGGHRIVRAKSFAWRATNCNNIEIHDGTIDFGVGNTVLNTDGYHWNGPCRNIDVRNVKLIGCADDALAFNADDGWAAPGIKPGPYVSYGDITEVSVADVYFQGSICGVRMLSGGSRMDNFSFRNIKGKTSAYWIVVDNFVPAYTQNTGAGNIGSIDIDGVRMENVQPIAGSWTNAEAHFNCKIEQLSIRNYTKGRFLNVAYPAILFGPKADIGQASIDGYRSSPFNGGTYVTDQITFTAGANIKSMSINNSKFDAPATNGCPITIPAGATIKQLSLSGNTGTGFTDFVSNAGTVNSMQVPAANNVMGTSGSTWTPEAGFAEVSDTAITFTGNPALSGPGVQVARKTAVDAYSANIQLSDVVRFTGTSCTALNAALLIRGLSLQPYSGSSRSAYVLDFNQPAGQVTLQRSNSSGDTVIGARITVSGGLAMSAQYKRWLTAKGSTISARVQRVSDGLYLQPNGTWAATAVDCASGTDTVYGAGNGLQYGVYAYVLNYNQAAAGVEYTNFTAIAAP
jgi:hypothetical protein